MTEPVAPNPVPEAPIAPASAPVESSPAVVETVAPSVESAPSTVLGADDAPSAVEPVVEADIKSDDVKTTETVETAPKEVTPEAPKESADKSAEKQPEGEKKDEASQSDEPAPLPTYEPWKLPENMTVDQSKLDEVTKMFAEFERDTKTDHALVQKFGQQIIDRHIENVQAAISKLTEAYQESWKQQTKDWYDAFAKDPEIGGPKKEVSAAAANEFIRRHGGTSEQQASLRQILEKTGLGNHPDIIRTFAKATSNLAEPKMIPAGSPPAAPTTRKTRFYGKKS